MQNNSHNKRTLGLLISLIRSNITAGGGQNVPVLTLPLTGSGVADFIPREEKTMSFHNAAEPKCTSIEGTIELLIKPEAKDLGELAVRRVLPSVDRKMVGPFIFFEHMGSAEFAPGVGIQVVPIRT